MSANGLLQIALFLGVLLALAKPLGGYMARVYEGKLPAFVRWIAPVENLFYRLCGVDSKDEMRWTRYALAMLWFALLSVLVVYGMQRLQDMLPLNPQGFGAVSPDSSFNTAITAYTSIPYKPEPTPPKITSPNWICAIGTSPPSGVKESCMLFTAPQEAPVVMVANRAELTMPKRVSLPSMLPPGCVAEMVWSTPNAVKAGLPCCSADSATARKPRNNIVMATRIAQPWRVSPTMLPKV